MKVLKVATLSGMATLAKMLSGFIVMKAVALYTGSVGVAQVSQIQGLISLITGTISGSAGTGVVKYIAASREDENEIIIYAASGLRMIILILLPIMLGLLIFSTEVSIYLTGNVEASIPITLLAALLPFYGLGIFIAAVMNGRLQYRNYIFGTTISSILSTLLIITFIYFMEKKGLLIAIIIGGAIPGLWFLWASRRSKSITVDIIKQSLSSASIKAFIPFIAMGLVAGISGPLWQMIVRLTIADNLSWSEAGKWQALWSISGAYLAILTSAISTYYFPRFSQTHTWANLYTQVKSAIKFVLPCAVLMAGAVYICRHQIILILYSEDFLVVEQYFFIQMIADVVKIICCVLAYVLLAKNCTYVFIFAEIAFSLAMVCMAKLTVPTYGLFGICYSYLLCTSIYMATIFVFLYVRHFRIYKA